MKNIEIEKELDLENVVDILTIQMQDNFIYRKENDGYRCVGPFYLKGRYTTENEVKDFREVFEFDIFAGNDKLLESEEFRVVYNGYDYTVNTVLTLYFHFSIYGIKDENHHYQEKEIPLYYEDNWGFEKEIEKVEEGEVVKEIQEIEENAEVMEDKKVDISVIEELFDEKDNVSTTYSFVVVKKGEDYESIANRFHIKSEELRQANNNKDIHEKSLLVLPYRKV